MGMVEEPTDKCDECDGSVGAVAGAQVGRGWDRNVIGEWSNILGTENEDDDADEMSEHSWDSSYRWLSKRLK